nr:MAG TPA: hypothetical protein [Caudoviricetes sp.]
MAPIKSLQKEQKMQDGRSTLIVTLPLMVFLLLPFLSTTSLNPHQKQHLPLRPKLKLNNRSGFYQSG